MKTVYTRRVALLIGVLISILVLSPFVQQRWRSNPNSAIALQPPPFLSIARAEANQPASFADDEAGIAGYIKVSQTIDLSKVDDLCRNITAQTSDYLICSIDVPDYDDNHSPTVYVHKDGWVMAYYPNSVPVSYLIDFRHYTGDANLPTKFEQVINLVTSKIGAPSSKATYYHFAYPNANKMVLIGEKVIRNSTDAFQVNLPATFSYFERSWSLGTELDCCAKVKFLLNDQEISTVSSRSDTWTYEQGTFTSNQMDTGDYTISVTTDFRAPSGFAGLGLVYQSS